MPEVLINNIQVRFPFEAYDVQKQYMEKVITCLQMGQNGILESPTGTGKTLCLLCASLGWLEVKKAEHKANLLCGSQSGAGIMNDLLSQTGGQNGWSPVNSCPKIIYSSRTHAQLSQAVKEFKKTTYKYMKVAVLGSRDQMCVHPEVSKEPNNNTKLTMCQIRVKGKNCYFYNQVDAKKEDPDLKKEVLDLEDLVKMGKKKSFCPYYMSKEIRQDADIIFLPYNYLLDPKTRKSHGIDLARNVVIFDEAHNVEKMCEESASLQFRSTDIALCIDDVTQVMKKIEEINESELASSFSASSLPDDFNIEDLYILKTIFLEIEKAIDEIDLGVKNERTFRGNFIFELLEKASITHTKKIILVEILDKLILYLTSNSNSPFQRKGTGLQKFADLMKIVFSKDNFSLADKEFISKCYRVHIAVEEKRKPSKQDGWGAQKKITSKMGKVLSYWCFNPGFGMKDLADQGVMCILLTSGTLSPIQTFTTELQIPFPIQLENPHIIKAHQVFVGTISCGPDNTELNSSYNNRSSPKYLSSLGQTIINIARLVPGGLLIFFPSYPVMKSCHEFWSNCGVWNSLSNIKPVYMEPQGKDNFITTMEEFYQSINDPNMKGACFMAVCRGKVSEGLDFANRNGRAVIITGLPYPPFKDPRVILKQSYLDEAKLQNKEGLSGASWYKLEASRAVNQAIGRVIRHKDDYGAIILCDQRFGSKNFSNELSAWVRPHMKVYGNKQFSFALRDLRNFFQQVKWLCPQIDTAVELASKPLKIEYEDTGSLRPVSSSAFQPTIGRPVNRPVRHTEHVTNYAGQVIECFGKRLIVPSPPETKQTTRKGLFDALEEKRLEVDFTDNSPIINFSSSTSTSIMMAPDYKGNNCAPRKKIKIVSQSEKNIADFCNRPVADENNPKAINVNKVEPAAVPSSSNNNEIVKYLKQVKSKLTKEEYLNFSSIIKRYSGTKDCTEIISVIIPLLSISCDRYDILRRFSVFLKPEQRGIFEEEMNKIIN